LPFIFFHATITEIATHKKMMFHATPKAQLGGINFGLKSSVFSHSIPFEVNAPPINATRITTSGMKTYLCLNFIGIWLFFIIYTAAFSLTNATELH